MSFNIFDKIDKKHKKHKHKKKDREITVDDFVECVGKNEVVADFLTNVAKSQSQHDSLKVPDHDYSGSSSDRDSRRSSRSRKSVSSDHSPRESRQLRGSHESMTFNTEPSPTNKSSQGANTGPTLQPMSAEEASKYNLLFPLLDPSDRPSNMNRISSQADSGASLSNQAPYPDVNQDVQPPSLPYPFQQDRMLSLPEPTIYLCDMNNQLRELIIKRLKSSWNPSDPLKSVEPLIGELNETQGREWTLDLLDNPCDVTGSRAYKGNVLSFSFDTQSKPYVLWRRLSGEFNSGYKEWLW